MKNGDWLRPARWRPAAVENKTYYQPGCTKRRTKRRPPKQNLLWVEQVSIPDYLAGNGWSIRPVTCSMSLPITICGPARSKQLRTTLVANLSAQLPGGWLLRVLWQRTGYAQCGG